MNTYIKDVIREIFKTRSRFFTLILIVFLSTLTYVGLNSTVDDIKNSVDLIIKKDNMYDIRIDAMGYFTDKDKELLQSINEIESINFYNEEVDFGKKILYIEKENLKSNEAISLINFNNSNLLPLYKIIGKGYDLSYPQTTIIKSGIKIDKAFYVAKNENKDKNVATIILKKDKKYSTFSKEYINYVSDIKIKINEILANRPYERENEIGDSIIKGINDIHKGIAKIDENKKNLVENRKKINENEINLKKQKEEFLGASEKFESGYIKIQNNKNELEIKKADLISKYKMVTEGLSKINSSMDKINAGLDRLNEKEENLRKNEEKLKKNSIFLSDSKKEEYQSKIKDGYNKIKVEKKKLLDVVNKKKELEKNKLELEDGLSKIKNGQNEINLALNELNAKKKKYYDDYNKNYNEIKNAENKLKNAKKKLSEGHNKLDKTKNDLEVKKEELATQKKFLVTPTYVVGSRYDNQAFLTLYNNIKSTKIMCYLFPICFFVIGLFISATTIIRFSEEQRKITGIYKFLGYKTKYIIIKSMVYGLIPTIIGLILGSIMGTYILPKLIAPTLVVDFINIFKEIKILFIPKYTIISFLIFLPSILIIIISIIYKQVKEKVVNLLTGKTEYIGKRILLEKLNIWKKLSFSKKILFRNIFKYKARMFMTLLGIGGCTALIYLGIALHYSISDINKYQYDKVKKYDAIVYFKYDVTDELKNNYITKVKKFSKVYTLNIEQVKYSKNGLDYHLTHEYLIEGNNKEFFNFDINENMTAVSRKTAKILNLHQDETITLTNMYNKTYQLKIDKIFDNYISQYVYTKNKDKKINSLLVKFKNKNNDDIDKLLDNEVVFNIQTKHDSKEFFEKQIKSLTKVVILMIILGASLSIVVTYNLGNINIIERKRELSTLKVLGYNKLEMNLYIFREIIILAFISILFGLYLGRKLLLFLAIQFKTSPIDLVVKLNYLPFLISFLLSIIFVFIVFILLIPKINKIDMIEALKAGE